MSQGLCSSCGAAVNLTAGQTEAKCQYCESVVTLQQAKVQFKERSEGNTGGLFRLAEAALASGDYKEALGYYNKAIEKDESSSEAWFGRALCYSVDSADLKGTRCVESCKASVACASNPGAMRKRLAKMLAERVAVWRQSNSRRYMGGGGHDSKVGI